MTGSTLGPLGARLVLEFYAQKREKTICLKPFIFRDHSLLSYHLQYTLKQLLHALKTNLNTQTA